MRVPAIISLAICLFAPVGGCRKPADSATSPPRPAVFKGDNVALKFPKKDTVPVFRALDTLDDFLTRLASGSDADYFLVRYGTKKFFVPAGTRAVVRDNLPDRYEIEFQTENETEKTGWVAAAWTEKVAPAAVPKP
jgi:hypothetical protein